MVETNLGEFLNDCEKLFYPTKEIYLRNAEDGIKEFQDQDRENGAPHKHAVVMTLNDVDEIRRRREKNPHSSEAMAADDLLSFVREEIKKYDKGGDDTKPIVNDKGGDDKKSIVNRPMPVGDNLYLIISDAKDINEFREKNRGSIQNLDDKLRIICQYDHEFIKYRAAGFRSRMVKFDKVDPNIRREGIKLIEDSELVQLICGEIGYPKKWPKDHAPTVPLNIFSDYVKDFYPNQYLLIANEESKPHMVGYVVGDIRWNDDHTRFVMGELKVQMLNLKDLMNYTVLDIQPKDETQALYFHALQQQHISRIFVTGEAGCGKTLIGYASALDQTLDDKNYHYNAAKERFRRIYITKPNDRIGGKEREMGFLKGDEQEKLAPLIRSYKDAHSELGLHIPFEFLAGLAEGQYSRANEHPEGILQIEDFANWRGRTFNNSILFLDEAQNLKPIEMKHLNQRAGRGSLIVISGDYEHQIDSGDSMSNTGLFQGLKHYLGQPYVAVIALEGSYRDAGAEYASRMRVY